MNDNHNMIFKFRLISDEAEGFFRDIEISADQSYEELSQAILDCAHFQPGEMNSFFLTGDNWEKQQEITQMDMGCEGCLTMKDTAIGRSGMKPGQKLLYVFDQLNERMFFMECVNQKPDTEGADYPVCVNAAGKPPPQHVEGNGLNNIRPDMDSPEGFSADDFDDLRDDFDDEYDF
jgi:hypothetical protein